MIYSEWQKKNEEEKGESINLDQYCEANIISKDTKFVNTDYEESDIEIVSNLKLLLFCFDILNLYAKICNISLKLVH